MVRVKKDRGCSSGRGNIRDLAWKYGNEVEKPRGAKWYVYIKFNFRNTVVK